jgi:hypothetical protein
MEREHGLFDAQFIEISAVVEDSRFFSIAQFPCGMGSDGRI